MALRIFCKARCYATIYFLLATLLMTFLRVFAIPGGLEEAHILEHVEHLTLREYPQECLLGNVAHNTGLCELSVSGQ